MTRVYMDWEFLEDGHTIEPISVALVAEDGREYYAVNSDAPWERIYDHQWLMGNVWPSLPVRRYDPAKFSPNRFVGGTRDPTGRGEIDLKDSRVKPHWVIANEVRDFLLATPDLELWGWYSSYDHVCLAQLFGPMVSLPEGIPMWTNDIAQEAARLGNPKLPDQDQGVHNALADARELAYPRAHRGLTAPARRAVRR